MARVGNQWGMLCVLLRLPFVASDVTSPDLENCFRLNENLEDALWWKTDGFVDIPTASERDYLSFKAKSSGKFYGNLTSEALLDGGDGGPGGFIGISVAFPSNSSCTLRPGTANVLVCLELDAPS